MLTKMSEIAMKAIRILMAAFAVFYGAAFIIATMTGQPYEYFNVSWVRTFIIVEGFMTAPWWTKTLWKKFWKAYAWTRVFKIRIKTYLNMMDEKIAGWRKA